MGLWSFMKRLVGMSKKDRPPTSLVLLQRKKRHLHAGVVAELAAKALGFPFRGFDPDDKSEMEPPQDGQGVVLGHSPLFMVMFEDCTLAINNIPKPYVDDPAEAAAQIEELRLRKAMQEHKAWLSVDLMSQDDDEKYIRKIYRHIGKLTAALADADSLAIYSPATDGMVPYDPELKETLCGRNPLKIFESPVQVPVVGVAIDDQKMKEAVREARQRWPEFVAAFRKRTSEQTFGVKVPVSDGENKEFMWIIVSSIDNDFVHGVLDNDPLDLKRIKRGAKIRAKLKRVNDWMYNQGEEMIGGFTAKVLTGGTHEE